MLQSESEGRESRPSEAERPSTDEVIQRAVSRPIMVVVTAGMIEFHQTPLDIEYLPKIPFCSVDELWKLLIGILD